ncbi:bifunctional transcriptional activator/DNA repair enzyme AdaA [Mariniblastus fucicola]|nr:methylated-DNA--[protein]-cysteine S-methyltransferase [Mariniblastus fucicola]
MSNTLFPTELPTTQEMYKALCERDSEYEGIFIVGVKTTGIFCRPTCPAKKPLEKNVSFYGNVRDALAAGFRPCKRCRPMEAFGTAPEWLANLLSQIEEFPDRRWKDHDLRELGLEPARVRRWFKAQHGMTFHCYQRTRRLGRAIGQIQVDNQSATSAQLNSGYESASGFRDAFKKLFENVPPSRARGDSTGSAESAKPMYVNRVLTELGPMVCAANEQGLHLLEFADRRMLETQIKRVNKLTRCTFVIGENEFHRSIQGELQAWFAGKLEKFQTPIVLKGTTFQEQVWRQLLQIRYGESRSYEQIAKNLENPKAMRAVGKANGDNRFAIVVPCHRVIRADGSLSGYGGGVWRKQWMLNHEQRSLKTN